MPAGRDGESDVNASPPLSAGVGSEKSAAASGPLAGMRVIDLTTARSGPTCVRQLADLGADVIQVAKAGVHELQDSDSWNLHRNKRSIVVDLQSDAGRDILLRLAERADVLVENWRPSVKTRLRIDPKVLWVVNPRLVYASISGYGQEGPYANRPGLDQVAQGMGGLMSVTGPPGTGPWRAGIAVADLAAGTFLTQGVLAALMVRERTGKGQWVHTSLLEAMVYLMDFQAVRWVIDKEIPKQTGNEHPTLPAMGTFRTRDGSMNIAQLSGFDRFFSAIGVPHLASDPRFVDDAGRHAHRAELNSAIQEALLSRTTEEWIRAIADDIACGPVLSMNEVFADPQVRHLELTRTVEHPTEGLIEVLRLPLTFSDTPASVRSGPPLPGAHTKEVLLELGFSAKRIAELTTAGIVAVNPAEQVP